MSTTSAPNRNSVRQQLDELDALLQRMLSLPINGDGQMAQQPAADSAALKDAWKAPAMTLLPASDPVPPPTTPEPPRWDPNWSINLNPQNGSSILGDRSPAAAGYRGPMVNPPTTFMPDPPVVLPMAEPAPARHPEPPAVIAFPEPPGYSVASTRSAPLPVFAWPLAAIDSLFDVLTSLFPFGSLLTTRLGKNFIGLLGIAMIVGGAAWGVLDFLGWSRR